MRGNAVVQRKLDLIGRRISKVRAKAPLSIEELEDDYFLRSGIERTLQVCIEAMIDVANRITCKAGRPASTDSFGSLKQLEEMNILADAERYRDTVKFWNLIVHRYEEIDTGILLAIVNNSLRDFNSFIREIERENRSKPE